MNSIIETNKYKFIYFFENCFAVKGAKRGCIFDVQRFKYDFIPNDLILFLEKCKKKNISDILKTLMPEDKITVCEYISFLHEKEYIFFLNQKELKYFPKINLDWQFPSLVSNAIIDFDKNSNHEISNIINMLNAIQCENIELRFFYECTISDLSSMLENFLHSNVKSIFVKCQINHSLVCDNELLNLGKRHFRLMALELYNKKLKVETKSNRYFNINIHDYDIYSNLHCGIVTTGLFNLNIDLFTESIQFNNCLNRKVAIDTSGNIKNCPSMQESYGNIRDTTLREALEKPGFKKYWNINKDQIEVCKDCEFRYICTDCRAYIEDPENMYSKPIKCGYNPYTCEWEEWSTNPLKQKAIKYYGMQELVEKGNGR